MMAEKCKCGSGRDTELDCTTCCDWICHDCEESCPRCKSTLCTACRHGDICPCGEDGDEEASERRG